MPKIVEQGPKYPIPYLYTLSRTVPSLNRLSRTLHYVNTLTKNANLTQNQFLVGSQSEPSTKKSKPHQPIKIEYYVTQKHPRALSCGGGLFSALDSSRLAIAYLNTLGPPPPLSPPDLLTHILLLLRAAFNTKSYNN